MGVFAGIALAITYDSVIAGCPIECSYFTWLAALIFALSAVRNSLPERPGIGTAVAKVAFFSSLATVTVCI